MDDSIRYTASEFVQLVTAGDQNISEFMSIEVDDDDTEKVVFRNVTEGWVNTDISRYACFTSLGQHRNFCVTFKCDMSAQRAVPCFGLTNTTNRPFSISNYLFMMETDIEHYLGDNNKTWLRANGFGSYGYMSGSYSYAKRSDSNTFTLCKQGFKSWLWMDGELLVYQDLSAYGSSSYNIPAYLCMFWEWQNMNLDWVKIYDIEISMNDYDIDVSFDYNIFTPVGNLLTIDASKCTQQDGEIVSADWDGVADTLIHKEYIQDDKIIKCDLFGSQGGHFTYYLHCFVGNGVDRKQEILNDVFYDFRKNWQQYDPTLERPSETAFLASLTSKCIIPYKTSPSQNPSALNFTHTLSDGLFSIDKGANKNAQSHFSYNLVKNFKNLENQYGNYSQSEINTYPANCIGIGLIWDRGTSYLPMFEILMGHNLMLKDGTDFEQGENLDVWKNRYGEDFLATGENPKFVYSVACPIQGDRMKIDFVRHGDRFMVYRNNELIIEIKNKLFADLASVHPTIYNIGYYSYESEYLYGVYHETVGKVPEDVTEEDLNILLSSSTSSPIMAIMIESESLAEPICLYKGFKDVYLQDIDGNVRLFSPSGMTVQLPERKSGGADALSFGIGDVSGQVLSICEQIRTGAKPAYITLLQYMPFPELDNNEGNAPSPVYNLQLFITGVSITTKGATVSAGWHDTLNAKFPFRRYTAKEFPGLKYVTR